MSEEENKSGAGKKPKRFAPSGTKLTRPSRSLKPKRPGLSEKEPENPFESKEDKVPSFESKPRKKSFDSEVRKSSSRNRFEKKESKSRPSVSRNSGALDDGKEERRGESKARLQSRRRPSRGSESDSGTEKPRFAGQKKESFESRRSGKKFEGKHSSFKGREKPRNEKSSKTNRFAPKYIRQNRDESSSQSPSTREGIRLNKYIANSGVCSRREADKLIADGLISINDEVVTTLGTKVLSEDVVKYAGEVLSFEKFVYILMNKPKDFITTADDPQGRRTVLDLLANKVKERVYPVGRLDRATTGVLLLTNDGELAKKLTHPSYEVRKVYQVTTSEPITKVDLEKLANGIQLEDGFVKPDAVSYSNDASDKREIGIELHSGKNRVIRRMMEALGYKVSKLDRVMFAGMTKKKMLRGKWRSLSEQEIGFLKMMK